MKIQESKIRKPMTQEDLDKVIKILKDKYKLSEKEILWRLDIPNCKYLKQMKGGYKENDKDNKIKDKNR